MSPLTQPIKRRAFRVSSPHPFSSLYPTHSIHIAIIHRSRKLLKLDGDPAIFLSEYSPLLLPTNHVKASNRSYIYRFCRGSRCTEGGGVCQRVVCNALRS